MEHDPRQPQHQTNWLEVVYHLLDGFSALAQLLADLL